MMNNFTKFLTISSLSLAVSGCSMLLPSSDSPIRFKNVEVVGEELNTEHAVDAYLITPKLLQELKPYQATAQRNPELDRQLKDYQYTIGVGDVLNVTVWDHPELTTPAGTYRSAADSGNQVHANGTVFYPYVGTISVVGKTVNQIRQEITKKLSKYVVDPQVEVTVASFQSKKAYITGEVKNPGQQFITNVPLTLLDAINKSGGLAAEADWHNVTITHDGKDEKVSVEALFKKGDLTQNRLLTNGDIVHVPRNDAQKVFVVGEVGQPQFLKIGRDGMSLTEAISASGGIDKLASDATGIFVIRGERGKREMVTLEDGKEIEKVANIYQLDVTNPTTYILGTDFFLKPYDVVYVTTAPITRWNRVISQIVPTINGFNELTEGMLRVRNW